MLPPDRDVVIDIKAERRFLADLARHEREPVEDEEAAADVAGPRVFPVPALSGCSSSAAWD